MKTFIYLILTAFIATGAMIAALNQHHVLLGYGVAFLLWGLFLRWISRTG